MGTQRKLRTPSTTARSSVRVAGPDVDGSGFPGAGDVSEASLCVEKVQGAEVEGIESAGSHASASGRVSSRLARQDAFRQGLRLRVPERPAQGQEARCPRPSWCRST
jgi:hypothetical protein